MNPSKHPLARVSAVDPPGSQGARAVAHIDDSANDDAVLIGYVPALEGTSVFTCLSAYTIAQETAHAVLDGLRHLYKEAPRADQPAIHEAFADIVELLSAWVADPGFGLGAHRGSGP